MGVSVYPKPQVDQSVSCYLRDLSRRNGFSSVALFTQLFFDDSSLVPITLTGEKLSKTIGKQRSHLEGLELLASGEGGQTHTFGRLEIPRYQLCRKERYCAECLQDQGICLSKWQIGWMPLCTKHKRPLREVTHEIERGLFRGMRVSSEEQPTHRGLLLTLNQLCEIQSSLEDRLELESTVGCCAGESIVELVDRRLFTSMRLESVDCLSKRRRRYPLQYYNRSIEDSIRFLEYFAGQVAA